MVCAGEQVTLVKPIFCKDHAAEGRKWLGGAGGPGGCTTQELRDWPRWERMGVRVGDGGGELVRPSGGKTNRTWREVDGGGVGGVGRREGGANKCELEHLGEGRRLIGRRAGGAGWGGRVIGGFGAGPVCRVWGRSETVLCKSPSRGGVWRRQVQPRGRRGRSRSWPGGESEPPEDSFYLVFSLNRRNTAV